MRPVRDEIARALRGLRGADGRAGPQPPSAVREVLPATGTDVRTVRAGARDRPQGRRRGPRPVRDLLDRTDDGVRAVRPGAPVPRGAARPVAVRRLCAGQAAALRALRPRPASDGPLARGPGLQYLLSPRSVRQERRVRRAGRRGGCFAIPDSTSPSAVTVRALTMITSARGAVRRKRSTSGGCAPAACLTTVSLSYSATQPNAPVVV